MEKSTWLGALIGGASALSIGGYAGYKALEAPRFAQVVQVSPVTQLERQPEQQCRDVTVTHRRPVKDEHRIVGTLVGGVIGGVVGNQVGKGSGKDVATVAGAAAGGFAGNRIQKHLQQKDTYTTTEQRCRTVFREQRKIIAYDVRYVLDGDPGTVRMKQKPGERIPVENGKLVLRSTP